MPLDRHARRFLEMLAAAGEARGRYDDVAERRGALINLADLVDPPGTVEIGGVRDHLLPVSSGHITLRIYSPLGEPARVLPGIVFFHGGGWVAGSLETHDGLVPQAVQRNRLPGDRGGLSAGARTSLPARPGRCGLPRWPMSARNPKHFGIDPARLGVAGDSAGGTLAAVAVPDCA